MDLTQVVVVPSTYSAGLLMLRVVFGLIMAAHGAQKLFGWFGGYGLAGTGGYFESLGYRPGRFFAASAGLGEFGSGVLVALGLLGPLGPALMIMVMVTAAISVHWANGLFATANGIEVPLLYAAAGAGLALTGHGRYSLDAMMGLDVLWTPALAWSAIVVGIVGGLIGLVLRRPLPAAPAG